MSIRSIDDLLTRFEGVRHSGSNGSYQAKCPAHDDHRASLSITVKDSKILISCHAGCATEDVVAAVKLSMVDLFLDKKVADPVVVREMRHDIRSYEGKLIATHIRQEYANGEKTFYWLRNGSKGLKGLKTKDLPLFNSERLADYPDSDPIVILEGEKKTKTLFDLGVITLGTVTGADGCPSLGALKPIAKRPGVVYLWPDNDAPGRTHMAAIAAAFLDLGKTVRMIDWKQAPPKGDAGDFVKQGGTLEQMQALMLDAKDYLPEMTGKAIKTPEYQPSTLTEILERCQKYLFMPDTGAVEILLGAIAANLLPGDPVWLLLVGPPGQGKTEILNTVRKVPQVHCVGVLTEASLLSGTPKHESKGAKGGLLRELGEFGIILVKDLGGILSITRESRGPILAALREVYDGSWTRVVGSDGGRVLTWAGKAGLIGGATPSIDRHYAVMATLGERFTYYRLPGADQSQMAVNALEHAGHEDEMREELANLVAGLFGSLNTPEKLPAISSPERDRLVALATLVVRCRSAVERDSFQNREIQLVPGAESPTRLVKVLLQLFRGLLIIGVVRARAWELVTKVAMDSMPALRQQILKAMLKVEDTIVTSELASQLGYPSNTTRRVLEDLACYGIMQRVSHGDGRADVWSVSDWTRKMHEAGMATLPEILKGDIP